MWSIVGDGASVPLHTEGLVGVPFVGGPDSGGLRDEGALPSRQPSASSAELGRASTSFDAAAAISAALPATRSTPGRPAGVP